ncbi:hypothetical protein PENTCL1PPCAC_3948, partial [Pristionchus entomophagus]
SRLFSCTMRYLLILLLLVSVAYGKWFNLTLVNHCSVGIEPLIFNNNGIAFSTFVAANSVQQLTNLPDMIKISVPPSQWEPEATKTIATISQYDNPPRSSYYIDICKGYDFGMYIAPWDDLQLGAVSCLNANCKTDGSAWFASNAYQGQFYVGFGCD